MNSRRAFKARTFDSTNIANTTSVLSRLTKFYNNLVNVHENSSFERGEMYSAEPHSPESSLLRGRVGPDHLNLKHEFSDSWR